MRGVTEAMASRYAPPQAEGKVACRTGEDLILKADTVCIHGDQPRALAFARKLREALAEAGVQVRPF